MKRVIAVLMLVWVALMPLAQAAECVMHKPTLSHHTHSSTPHTDHTHHLDSPAKPPMRVADCMPVLALPSEDLPLATLAFEPAAALFTPRVFLYEPRDATRQPHALVPLRVPPPDVLSLNARRRI